MSVRAPCLLVPALLTLAGCALLGKNEPVALSYYSPALVAAPPHTSPRSAPTGAPLTLRIVEAGDHLGPLMVYRTSDVSYGLYETRRWTEEPSVYLRRLLERVLFEDGARARSSSSRAATLEVELIAFEEVVGSPRAARVALVLTLTDAAGRGVLQRTIDVTRPSDGDEPEDVVQALGLALREAVDQTARAVDDAQGPAAK